MNDPDRNTKPGFSMTNFHDVNHIKTSKTVVPSRTFKAGYPLSYPFYYNSVDFVPQPDQGSKSSNDG